MKPAQVMTAFGAIQFYNPENPGIIVLGCETAIRILYITGCQGNVLGYFIEEEIIAALRADNAASASGGGAVQVCSIYG